MSAPRKIIHCDCDCFYASIEVRDNPQLAGLPVAVGGHPQRRGVVATCNYAARSFGVHSAMASATARKICPELVIVRPNMEKYRVASQQIHGIFRQFTQLIEPLSLDEAYLDVTACPAFDNDASRIAADIRRQVKAQLGITISAGIAPNKFLAKIASDWNKPDGQYTLSLEQIEGFLDVLPVKKLHGVGRVTANRMHQLNINTCGDLRRLSPDELSKLFGSFGTRLHELCRGIDERPVQTSRVRKSLSVENTYTKDLQDEESCLAALPQLHEELLQRLQRVAGRYTISKQFIKIKFNNFTTTTAEMLSDNSNLQQYQALLSEGYDRGRRPVRLLGLGVKLTPVKPVDAIADTREYEADDTETSAGQIPLVLD